MAKIKDSTLKVQEEIPPIPGPFDPWKHRSVGMLCNSCMWYVSKASTSSEVRLGRCRRHSPTMSGYPVVFHNDWCGDHKMDENKI